MNKLFCKKREFLAIQTALLLSLMFLAILPQTQAVKPSLTCVTMTSPNPLAYVSGSGIPGGMYGGTVACGGGYIFVHGEDNFYVYNALTHRLIYTIAGTTIAIGGGYVAIGNASYTSTSSKVDIYRLNNLGKVVATLTAPEEGHIGFGLAMAFGNGKMLISDVGKTSGDYPYSGDVYVYSVASFNYITKLEQKNPEVCHGSPFGDRVAFCGNHIVVGAPDQTVNGQIYSGNVYLYNSKTYAWERTIPNPDAATYGMFGSSIAVAGGNIWIGEPGFTYPYTTTDEEIGFNGKVYCFTPNGEQVASLSTPKPAYGGFFGRSLATYNNYLLVGAPGESVDTSSGGESTTISYAGRVYMYTLSGAYIKTLTSLHSQIYGLFGSSVALGQDFCVVGAPEENATVRCRSSIQTYYEAGQAYIQYNLIKCSDLPIFGLND